MKIVLAVLALALAAEWARGEWVQVPVIDGRKQVTTHRPQGPQGPQGPQRPGPTPAPPPPSAPELAGPPGLQRPGPTSAPRPLAPALAGPPGPSADDVITIRRTVGDSFSNKQGAVPPAGPQHPYGQPGLADEYPEDHGADAEPQGLSLRVLREAHQTLLRQSAAPVSGKLEFLRRLKNRMLRHIASLMPLSAASLVGAVGAAASGRALGLGALGADGAVEGRGHKGGGVGFPSNESTLLSLAFLVFAVFLVKVVMQLIYAVQNSQTTVNAGVRVAQMQLPSAGMSNMVGSMMGMVPAMMPPMMAAMNPAMGMAMGGMRRARGASAKAAPQSAVPDGVDAHVHEEVDRMTSRVLDAIHKAKARVEHLGATLD